MHLYSFLCITILLVFSAPSWALKVYRTGSLSDARPHTWALHCLSGGGSDDAWASGWKKLLQSSQHGDIVIVRADGSRGDYEKWIYEDTENHNFPKVNSVTTLSFESAGDSYDPRALALLRQAEMIFFAGGDQTLYLDFFTSSPVSQVLDEAVKTRRVSFAGTSAGMAILGKFDYSGQYSSPTDPDSLVSSSDVLKNPLGIFVDIRNRFLTLPFLQTVATDSHFSERDRHGRLVGFMARASYNFRVLAVKGVGVDEGTALCFDQLGHAQAHGVGSAFLIKAKAPIERIEQNISLHWYAGGQALEVTKISAHAPHSNHFDLTTWQGSTLPSEHWAVDGSDPQNPLLLRSPYFPASSAP
ncbi:MAG: cyanophycinase [Bdellovibrio sp.]|nr:cyanophycinase [Bdellovibrio sp.]